jgi:hypothetical protein
MDSAARAIVDSYRVKGVQVMAWHGLYGPQFLLTNADGCHQLGTPIGLVGWFCLRAWSCACNGMMPLKTAVS